MNAFLESIGYGNALIVLGTLIFVHEMGHYLAARWCGVRVDVFSLGFGPEIAGYTDRRGTRWKLSLLPLGGYVKMLDENLLEPQRSQPLPEDSLAAKPLSRRALVVAAGPLANMLFAVLALAAGAFFQGKPVAGDFATDGIGTVLEGSAAAAAGLRTGDRILTVDGQPVASFGELANKVRESGGKTLRLEVARDGARQALPVTPRMTPLENGETTYLLGVRPPLAFTPVGLSEALWAGTRETWALTALTVRELGKLFTGQADMDGLAGPVRIVQISGEAGGMGADALLRFMAILSINLGLLNLLPLPVLDGGHLLFYALEAVRGRPLSLRLRQIAMQAGMILLLGLMVLLVVKDTASLLGA